jgi:Methyltransferase domain
MASPPTRSFLRSAFKYWRQSYRWKRKSLNKTDPNHFTRWRKSISSGRSALGDNEPWITFAARDFLLENLQNTSRVFEWGSGGSTLFILHRAAEVHTVEHDKGWFNNVQNLVRTEGFQNWRGQLVTPMLVDETCLNLDPAVWRNYQSGCQTLSNFSFKEYATCIDQHEDGYFDIIIVDGRARPSCLFHAWKKLKPNGLLFLDNAEVDYYKPICDLLSEHCVEQYSFGGAGPYISSFWLTCAWRRPTTPMELPSDFQKTTEKGLCQ